MHDALTIPCQMIFYSVLRPFQDYFSSYETGQSVGGAKTGEPREKPPGTPASRTWLVSHGQSGARTHTRHSSERPDDLGMLFGTRACSTGVTPMSHYRKQELVWQYRNACCL